MSIKKRAKKTLKEARNRLIRIESIPNVKSRQKIEELTSLANDLGMALWAVLALVEDA